jgi:hydroxymethylbilane synthase
MGRRDEASDRRRLRIATRGSPLALTQAQSVADRIGAACGLEPELLTVRTRGDDAADVPIDRIGGQGAFVKEVQAAVLDGRADLAVHSAKDLPPLTPPGLVLACVPERADPRDALVGATLGTLPTGAVVATGSVRRRAQLAWLRPDLTFAELRGNMRTRLDKARAAGAGVVAVAALERLGLQDEIDDVLDFGDMLPQVGQGALAVECRHDDEELRRLLAAVDDGGAHREVLAERAFLATLGGGCTLPAGALARSAPAAPDGAPDRLRLDAMLASADGRVLLRATDEGDDAETLGTALAHRLLDDDGGRALAEFA